MSSAFLKTKGHIGLSVLAVAGFQWQSNEQVLGQSILLTNVAVTGSAVQLQVAAPPNAFYRVDFSPDLVNWLPVDYYYGGNGLHTTTDQFGQTNAGIFYRVLQVADTNVEVIDYGPGPVNPGGQITVYGQFLPPLSQYTVSINGVNAQIIGGSSAQLLVKVPTNAGSGVITVATSAGSVQSSEAVTVLSNAVIRFQPPAGLPASNFVIANNYGTGVLISNTAADYSVPVREGFPTLSFAAVPGEGSNLFFCAMSFGGEQVTLMNANSTAAALVFQDWNFCGTDPTFSASLMAIIQTNAAVENFASALAAAMVNDSLPYQDPAVTNAYQAAVISVFTNESFSSNAVSALVRSAPTAAIAGRSKDPIAASGASTGTANSPNDVSTTSYQIYNVINASPPANVLIPSSLQGNGRCLEVTGKALSFSVSSPDYLFNPVDWIVRFDAVDVDATFPGGKPDFDNIWWNTEYTPLAYATNGLFYAQRSVGANLFSSRLNLTGLLLKSLTGLFTPKIDTSVTVPPGDAMYVVRGVGPSFYTAPDFAYVQNQLPVEYLETLAVNISAVAFQLLGQMTDDKSTQDLIKHIGDYNGLVTSAIQQGPIQDVDDFKRTVYTILKDIIKDYLKDQVKDSAGAAIGFAAKNFVSAQTLLDAASGPLGALKKASTVGQIGERLIGLTDTTALETSFIVVGNPFALNNVQMIPAAAAPGQTVTVTFKGSTRLQAFNPDNGADSVQFLGETAFSGEVESVSGPDASGTQTLKVMIPENINPFYLGPFTMSVLTQGRTGSAGVTISTGAALTSVSPLEGFAPAAQFNGSAYPGTAVVLQGAVFTASDTFLFTAGTTTVTATSVQGNGTGYVTINVPAGATTGPIQILHSTAGGTLTIPGPVFTVLGLPTIFSVQPYPGAPIGAILDMAVNNAGHNPSLIYVSFPGGYPQNPNLQSDGTLSVYVPYGIQTGPGNLTVFTPAGSNYIPFNIYPPAPVANLTAGAQITIGGSSIITLARAIAFADGTASPSDAEAQSGISTYNSNPNNQSAWQLGPTYTHIISGTSSDDGNFDVSFDSIYGTYGGNIVFSGNNNTLYATFQGSLSVSGVSNYMGSPTVSGAVSISGSYNTIASGYYHGPMTVSGVENTFSLPTFQNVPASALTILSNFNTGSCNFQSNAGDGLVINGGKYNQLTVNQSVGNTGNGVTLTGGATANHLTVSTGAYSNQYFGVAGTGNLGHGVALIGSASANVVQGLSSGLSGNGLDGIYLDGAGVVSNIFYSGCSFNGRNGVTITNAASMNSIGTLGAPFFNVTGSKLITDYNGGSGVVCAGCGPNQVSVLTQKNGQYGVLISGVKAPADNFFLVMSSGATGSSSSPVNISGNGSAGLHLEQGTSGIQAYATLGLDIGGLELDGADVTNNFITATCYAATGNGVALTNGANNNSLYVGVSASRAEGILLDNVSNNLVQVFSSTSNTLSGIHVTHGSAGNFILGVPSPSLYLGVSVGSSLEYNQVDGCLVDGGSSNNILDNLVYYYNHQDGLAFSGGSVTGNQTLSAAVSANGRDGVRFEMGASSNTLGSDPALNPTSPTDIYLTGPYHNGEAGIMITDPGTSGNIVQGGFIAGELIGITAQNQAEIGQINGCTVSSTYNGIVLQGGASDGTLRDLTIEYTTNAGLILSNVWNVQVGGVDATSANSFFGNPTAIEISGATATNNVIENNVIRNAFNTPGNNGIYLHDGAMRNQIVETNLIENCLAGVRIEASASNRVSQLVVEQNPGPGIIIARGAADNRIEQNVIEYNTVGVLISDAGSVGNSIRGNSIFYNAGKGIELSAGGNNEIAPPTLPAFTNLVINGTSIAPDGSIVEIFWDPYDQGEVYLGGGPVLGGHFRVNLDLDPTTLGYPNLNATVTDPDGNTSEFSGLSQQLVPLPNLAFTATNSTGHRQIYYSADGGNPVSLTQPWNASVDNFNPALPGGVSCGQLLFVSLASGSDAIYVMNPKTNATPQLVTGNPAGDFNPAWLIPCQRIVFVSQRDGNPQLYAVNLDGSNLQRLTTNSFADTQPAASLDGSKIVFVSNRSGNNELWIMNSDGSNPAPVAGVSGTPAQPAFSPDGNTIAYAAAQNGVSEIALVTSAGTSSTMVTSDGAQATHPVWLPDGQHLVFSSNRAGATVLYSIMSNGMNIHALAITPNVGTEPTAAGD